MRKFLLFFLGLFLWVRPVVAATFPSPTGFVNDFANVLTADQRTTLENNLSNFQAQTGNEITVVTIKNLEGDVIENVAVRLFEQWQIGQKEKDNGVLLLIAIDDRKLRIEVGYGLEPLLTDAKAGDIIRNEISPRFKEENYYQGIFDGVTAIQQVTTNQELPNSIKNKDNSPGAFFAFLMNLGFFGLFILIVYTAAFLGRSKAIWPGGVIGLILGLILGGIIVAVFAGLLGLFLDWILSRNYERLSKLGKNTDFWHTGGGFWTGGSGGGGFGGFSGGSSGGGGSSGSW